jgi:hypothetical protein
VERVIQVEVWRGCDVPRFVGRDLPVPHTEPSRGQDNAAFYSALGLTEQELVALRNSRSI